MPSRCRAICLALLLSGCAPNVPATPARDAIVVYVIQRGWHTDIGLAVDRMTEPLVRLATPLPGARFLTFGFGERQFLVNRRTDFGAMLKALLPSRSAMLMTALRASPEDAFGSADVVALPVSRAALAGIEAAVWNEFELSAEGVPVRLADGPYAGSDFYAARDAYDALFTCNTWTAGTLRAGGLAMPGTGAGVLFAGQVMGMARWIGARHAAGP